MPLPRARLPVPSLRGRRRGSTTYKLYDLEEVMCCLSFLICMVEINNSTYHKGFL